MGIPPQALPESESQFRALTEAIPHIVWAADASGAVDYYNQRAYAYGGVRENDVIGWNWASVIHPDDREATLRTWREAIQAGRPYQIEHRLRRADGEFRWHLTRGLPLRDERGCVTRWLGSATDIHDQKLSQRKYASILETAPLGFWLSDLEGKLLEVNESYCRMSGYGRDELIRMRVQDLEALQTPEDILRHIQHARDRGSLQFETRHRRKDGTIVDVGIQASYVDVEGGRLVVFINDISDRKRADAKLAWLASYPELNPNPLLEIEGDTGAVVYMNPAARRLFPDLFQQSAAHPFLAGLPEAIAALRREPSKPVRREVLVGGACFAQTISQVPGVNRVRVHTNDITGRKQAEDAREKARTEAILDKNRLEAVMQALPIGVALVDDRGGVIQTNRAFEDIWGAPIPTTSAVNDYVAFKAWWVDSGRPVQPEEWASARAVQKGETVVGQLMRIQRFDGKQAFIHNSAAPIRDANGRITSSAVVIQDITDLKEAEEKSKRDAALAAAAKTALDVVSALLDGTALIGLDGRILAANPALARLVGADPESMVGRDAADYVRALIAPPDRPEVLAALDALRHGRTPPPLSATLTARDGRSVPILITPSLVRDSAGRPTAAVVAVKDMSDLRRSEETIRSLARFPEENPNPVLRIDPDGTIRYANPASAPLLDGWKTLLGGPLPPDLLPLVQDVYAHGPATTVEHACGGRFYLINISPFREAGYLNLYGRDITIRRQAEDALRQSERRLSEAQRIAHLGNWDWNIRTNELLWSDEIYRIFGLKPQAFGATYDAFLKSVHPGDRALVQEAVQRAVREKAIYDIDHRILLPSGETRFVHEWGEVSYGELGDPVRMVGTVQDVTASKRAEDAVKAERQRLHDVMEMLPVYVVLLTKDYHVSFANRFFRERFGEDHGRCCFEYLFNRAEPCENCESYKVLKTRSPHHWEWLGPDGRNYDIHDFLFTDADGAPLIMEMGIDVTERKRAEEALRRAGAYNRSLIEASLDTLVTIGPDGRITDVNAATEAATGFSRAELIGRDFSDFFTDPEKARAGYRAVFEREFVRDYPLEIKHRDGRVTPVLYNASLYRDEAGKVVGVFAAARDMTGQRQMEEILRRSREQLWQAQKMEALGHLAAGTAHDYNNILSVIAINSSLLQDHVPPGHPGAPHLEEIQKAGQRAAALVRQLLTFGRRHQFQPQDLDLNAAVSNAQAMLQRLVGSAIGMTLALEPALGPVRADPTQIEQVLMNLTINARDAMPQGGTITLATAGVELSETVERIPTSVVPGRYVLLTVSDTGPGIAPEILDHLFEPFYTTKEEGKGTGLGLATVYGIVKQHAGYITVKSELGRGTTFRIYLPRAAEAAGASEDRRAVEPEAAPAAPTPAERQPRTSDSDSRLIAVAAGAGPAGPAHADLREAAEPARARPRRAPAAAPGSPSRPLTLMWVEDDEMVRKAYGKLFASRVDRVVEAADGQEALDLWDREAPDLVVTDLRMPRLDGLELARRLQAKSPRTPVLLLTGVDDAATAVEAMKIGVVDYLVKPVDRQVLVDRVRAIIETRVLPRRRLFSAGFAAAGPDHVLVTASPRMEAVLETIAMVRGNRSSVLIHGESGTGKEVVARAIHAGGPASARPFIAVNCAGIPEGLLESQLFGHVRGAFTGAVSDAPGFFRAAEGGTLFLDEIAEMPAALQTRLLRAIQEREVTPVGGTQPVKVDVRLIAATNQSLERAVADGRLRADLFYRLAVVPIFLPPLRERPEDISLLVAHFSARLAEKFKTEEKTFSTAAIERLAAYRWPGNIRELQNLMERLYATHPGPRIDARDLPLPAEEPGETPPRPASGMPTLEDVERKLIREVLLAVSGNRSEAARILRIERHRLSRKIKKYGLDE